MSNSYGFDFLRTDHRLDEDGQPLDTTVGAGALPENGLEIGTMENLDKFRSAANKPDLEKQFDILAFLQAHRGSGCLAPSVIYRATGIDLDVDVKVADMLQKNPKIKVELVPDAENPSIMIATYAYQAKYSNVRDRTSLLAQINRMTSGVPMRDLLDSYQTVEKDLLSLIAAGDIIAVANTEDKDKILFPRGDVFYVELDGIVSLPPSATTNVKSSPGKKTGESNTKTNGNNPQNGISAKASSPDSKSSPTTTNGAGDASSTTSAEATTNKGGKKQPTKPVYVVETDVDPRTQIRRGEAIQVGGQWFRVSSAVREGVSLQEQPARAQAPLSVVSLVDLSKRNEIDGYIRPLSKSQLPLDHKLSLQAQNNIIQSKAARDRLVKLSHGRGSGGSIGQLLGSLAHSSNPTTLAASITSSAGTSAAMRAKRPNAKISTTGGGSGFGSGGGVGGAHPHHTTPGGEHPNDGMSSIAIQKALKEAASDPSLCLYQHAVRHGATKDVREMYLATRELVPTDDKDLHAMLLKHKLLEPGEQLRRDRLKKSSNVDNDGKPKKRRYYERKNQRMTNTHLEGTEIGAVLALAAEKQKQGKSVGDGGM